MLFFSGNKVRVWALVAVGWAMVGLSLQVQAQDADLLLGDDIYHLIDRIDIRARTPIIFPIELKPYPRHEVAEWLTVASEITVGGSRPRSPFGTREKAWMQRARMQTDDLFPKTRARGTLRYFYRNKRDFLGFESEDKKNRLYVNPVIYMGLGADQNTFPAIGNRLAFVNTRGASIRGSLFGQLGFYAQFADNQVRLPGYLDDFKTNNQQVVPGEGWFKPFGTGGYDFFSGKGYLTWNPSRHFRLKLGRDQAFWGVGYQSLMLSNHAVDHLMLNYRLRFGKIEYVHHTAQFIDYFPNKPDNWGDYPRKYGVFHALYWRPSRKFALGLYESTIYASQLPNGSRGFELQYLNPLMFYRAIEQSLGSPDNSLLGLEGRLNLFKRIQLYGQFMLDDLNISELRKLSGHFGNKFGMQAGFKWIDVFGLETLDLQGEFNIVRPYMYAHVNPASNYAHYDQALAHPLGANFYELVGILRYRPVSQLAVQCLLGVAKHGLDDPTNPLLNYGGNIYRTNSTFNNGTANRFTENRVGQGIGLSRTRFHTRIGYEFGYLNLFAELEAIVRRDGDYNSTAVLFNLRWHLPNRSVRI
jgi:hypothetical protein